MTDAVLGAFVVLAIQVVLWAVAWGDMRRQVANNRERQDERHDENTERLERIEEKVDKVNGTLNSHGARLDGHDRELNWIRGQRKA